MQIVTLLYKIVTPLYEIVTPLYKSLKNVIELASYPTMHCITKMMTLKCCYRGQLEFEVGFYTLLITVINIDIDELIRIS